MKFYNNSHGCNKNTRYRNIHETNEQRISYTDFLHFLRENFEWKDDACRNYEKIIEKMDVSSIVNSCIKKANKIAQYDLLGIGALLFTGGHGIGKRNPYSVFFVEKNKVPVLLEPCKVEDAPNKSASTGGRMVFPINSIGSDSDDISFDDLDKQFPSIEFKEHEKNKKYAVIEKCGFPLFQLKSNLEPIDFIYNSLNELVHVMHMGTSDPIEVLVKGSHGDEKLLTELNDWISKPKWKQHPESATAVMEKILLRMLKLSDGIFATSIANSIEIDPEVGAKFKKMFKPIKK